MTRNIRLGTFILVGGVILLAGLFAIGNRTFLFSNTINVRAQFSRVAGLQRGASVQYQGINVGRVSDVQLPLGPGQPIEVAMAITSNASHLLRSTTQAQIKSDGLVGEQIIVLVADADAVKAVQSSDKS